MFKLLRCTTRQGTVLFLNITHIVAVIEDKYGAIIFTGSNPEPFLVSDSAESIFKQILPG